MPSPAPRSWAPGPLHPLLSEGAVHVWRADLTAVSDDLLELLGAEECARAQRIPRKRDRQLWKRAHGVLRTLLGRYLQMDPSTLRFADGAHGKPALLDDPLSFNISHSGQLALYAFAQGGAVGVDVELVRRPIDEVAIAARAFGPAEARRLEALEPAIREREFLRAWVRVEAELKCRGTGIGAGNEGPRDDDPWLWLAELEVGPRAAGAVALEHPPRELRCWDCLV